MNRAIYLHFRISEQSFTKQKLLLFYSFIVWIFHFFRLRLGCLGQALGVSRGTVPGRWHWRWLSYFLTGDGTGFLDPTRDPGFG